jgi:2-dehydropantoate 2-reductase
MAGEHSYKPSKFAVVGAGPVGAIMAAFLSNAGYEVTLCDVVPSLLEPAIDRGIIIEGTDTLHAKVAKTVTSVEELAADPPDVTVVTVKATALPALAPALAKVVTDGRYAVSWQNGIDTELVLAQHLGIKQVMRGVVNMGCVPVKPAHVRIAFHHRPHFLQELDSQSKDAALAICGVFTECGLNTNHTDQITNMVWRKAVLNACMNPICAITRRTMGEIVSEPTLFSLVDALMKEGIAVARANEFALGTNFYAYCVDYLKNGGSHKPSMLQDLEAGRKTEVDFINGKIVEYGVRAGMATPYNTMVRGLVKALELGGSAGKAADANALGAGQFPASADEVRARATAAGAGG